MRPEIFPEYDCKLDNLRFYVLYNSISVIPGGRADDNEMLCAISGVWTDDNERLWAMEAVYS